jgi:hypothetical protein
MGDKNKGFKVWKFNPEMNNVQAAPVEIASLQGEFAVVSSGVNVGDKIVSAAVNQMSKGLKVKEYKAEY